jgi:hypothetical protein
MFYEKLAQAKQDKEKRKGYAPELTALGATVLGGVGISRMKADPEYMKKRKNVLSIMHTLDGAKSRANVSSRKALDTFRKAKALGIGAGGLLLGVAGKSAYDKRKENSMREKSKASHEKLAQAKQAT